MMRKFSKILLLQIALFSFVSFTGVAQSKIGNTYEAVEGKTIGIWPHNDRFNSIEKMNELKERWGFEYILLAAIYSRSEMGILNKAGYDSLHIAFQIYLPDLIGKKASFLNNLKELGKIWAYYFDEPISRDHSYKEFLGLLSFLSDNGLYPHAQFIVSELDEKKAKLVLPFIDNVTYSGYGNQDKMGFDQAKTWSEWKDYLGEKFGMLWISSDLDSNEYKTLFKTAKEIDINSIWLYALEPLATGKEVSNDNYDKFCEAAVEFGYMKIRKKN